MSLFVALSQIFALNRMLAVGSRPSFLNIPVNLLGGVIRRQLNRHEIVDDKAERRENCVEFALEAAM